MKQVTKRKPGAARQYAASVVLLLALVGLLFAVSTVRAAPLAQEGDEAAQTPETEGESVAGEAHAGGETTAECQSCHLDIAAHWESSPHAHAYDDPVFQQQWAALGKPGDCLRCHTTNYEPATALFAAEGVACEACHGASNAEHPPAVVPVLAGPGECGDCHTTTLNEWHGSGHAAADVDCMSCHNPHNQQPLFADADEMCLNCHEDTMGDYLEDIHFSKDIGCVDCHALVIPPETAPQDGIVPTGHGFTITPGTCVACHTDSLHSGFSLPGYEHGATAAEEETEETVARVGFEPPVSPATNGSATQGNGSSEQQVQVLEAALASRRVTTLFQGGLVGLTFGGVLAWFVASNLRSRREDEEIVDEEA